MRPARAIGFLLVIACAFPSSGKVLVSTEQAVKEAFRGVSAEKRTDYLTDEQAARIASLAGSEPSSKIIISWRARKDGRVMGTAYLETHLVRTLPETILVVVDPDGRIQKVEILSFDEPAEYLPRPRWLDQFRGRALDPELSLHGAIRGITGATLSSRAIASAVRRVLAAHAVLNPATARGAVPGPPAASQPTTKPPAADPKLSPTPAPGSLPALPGRPSSGQVDPRR